MPERNPFEETRQAAQDWSPREQYISRSNQDRAYDATVNRFIQESQGDQQRWEQGGGQGAYPVFNEPGGSYNAPVSPGWLQASSGRDNSGIMMAMANNQQGNAKKWLDTYNIYDDEPENNSGIRQAALNNAGANQMMSDYFQPSLEEGWLDKMQKSKWYPSAGFDFMKDHAPEYLALFQDIKDKAAMARDPNKPITLPENEKLGPLSDYELPFTKGFYPYANPSWIENNPSYGLDYMSDLPWDGKGRVGFRKGLDDENYNIYAGLRFEL